MSQVVLNAVFLAAESLPRGGVIALADAAEGRILVTITGTHAAWPRELRTVMNRPEAAWAALSAPGGLPAPLMSLIAAHAGVHLSLHPSRRVRPAALPALLLSPI